ncbi:hypothetical protein HAHE_10050 [Haloferula helveola]|uniref:HEAT repeat domain-containing protein n=2 Tax=Haloferula helveola TaxID=490095 RepID=A0ABM7RCK9_9BACT|nr:hypothetical protein HAHE_10050 [Haloferula helveola]
MALTATSNHRRIRQLAAERDALRDRTGIGSEDGGLVGPKFSVREEVDRVSLLESTIGQFIRENDFGPGVSLPSGRRALTLMVQIGRELPKLNSGELEELIRRLDTDDALDREGRLAVIRDLTARWASLDPKAVLDGFGIVEGSPTGIGLVDDGMHASERNRIRQAALSSFAREEPEMALSWWKDHQDRFPPNSNNWQVSAAILIKGLAVSRPELAVRQALEWSRTRGLRSCWAYFSGGDDETQLAIATTLARMERDGETILSGSGGIPSKAAFGSSRAEVARRVMEATGWTLDELDGQHSAFRFDSLSAGDAIDWVEWLAPSPTDDGNRRLVSLMNDGNLGPACREWVMSIEDPDERTRVLGKVVGIALPTPVSVDAVAAMARMAEDQSEKDMILETARARMSGRDREKLEEAIAGDP